MPLCRLLAACLAINCLDAVCGGELAQSTDVDTSMSERVDELLAARWSAQGVTPAPATDDSELLRRLHLDLTGVIPTVSDARAYLADARPEKRGEMIDRLLSSPAHATHLAQVWRDWMLPRKLDPEQAAGVIGLERWLRQQFLDNQRYDRVVADLLVATGGDESGPALFYTAAGLKPEELGAATARIFLGVRLDCAQCHNHPFDRWTQQDFWGYAAFFAQVQQRSQNAANARLVDVKLGEARLPDSDTVVPPRYLGGTPVGQRELGTRRQQLAIWMVSRENSYLSRATVNFVWSQLFGRGLVEPLDDFGSHNPPSHPELLDELANYFVKSQCDLRRLYRMLTNTRAYQLGSRTSDGVDSAPVLFARMAVKSLTPEQLYDSLSRVALESPAEATDRLMDSRRQQFLIKMQTQTRSATDFELGVPQALTLINGSELGVVTDAVQSRLIKSLDAPFFQDEDRVTTLFLAVLSRLPNDDERAQFMEYLTSSPGDRNRALSDAVWALLNSAEFALNH